MKKKIMHKMHIVDWIKKFYWHVRNLQKSISSQTKRKSLGFPDAFFYWIGQAEFT